MKSLAEILADLHERRLQAGMKSEEGQRLTLEIEQALRASKHNTEPRDWQKAAAGDTE